MINDEILYTCNKCKYITECVEKYGIDKYSGDDSTSIEGTYLCMLYLDIIEFDKNIK